MVFHLGESAYYYIRYIATPQDQTRRKEDYRQLFLRYWTAKGVAWGVVDAVLSAGAALLTPVLLPFVISPIGVIAVAGSVAWLLSQLLRGLCSGIMTLAELLKRCREIKTKTDQMERVTFEDD